jgi:hypothetical protein
MKPIISLKQAKANGLKRYFTGEPCKAGHISERDVAGRGCVVCRREAAARWKNKPDVRPRMLEYGRQRYASPEGRAAILNAHKKRRADSIGGEILRERCRQWGRANPDKMRANGSARRARESRSIPTWFAELDQFAWEEAAHLAILRRQTTGIDWHADHMLPLAGNSVCGLHTWNNVQVIPAAVNTAKKNRMTLTEPGQWIRAL